MGNKQGKRLRKSRHHECEIFHESGQLEATESNFKWRNCTKNPGHEHFISAQDFKDNYLPKTRDLRTRELLRCMIDLTVRLRVFYTSRDRPDDDELALVRGLKVPRSGTGMIRVVPRPESDKPCPCPGCGGKVVKKWWEFVVYTALHVVFNTEEAAQTKIDMFLDEEGCDLDGRMKSVWGMEVSMCDPKLDGCYIRCVTCDEALGERIESARRFYYDDNCLDLDISGLDLLSSWDRGCLMALIISHPHGQPKKITVGDVDMDLEDENSRLAFYNVPTCPGSSGATLHGLRFNKDKLRPDGLELYFASVHSGTDEANSTDAGDHFNFGFIYL